MKGAKPAGAGPDAPPERTGVALGIVHNAAQDQVLIARRSQDAHLGGLWEFPGGKIRAGETSLQALRRELAEETGIEVREAAPLLSFPYDYPGKPLRFAVWEVTRWRGAARGKEGQEIAWADRTSLSAADFPAANKGIIAACKLPSLYLITPDLESYPPDFVEQLAECLSAGVSLTQFRSKKAGLDALMPVLAALLESCQQAGARLLVNGAPDQAAALGAAGVHLNSDRLMQTLERPLPRPLLVAASCHNRPELEQAVKIDADFCVLGPVRRGHGDAAPLGWDSFAALASQTPIPVYALGGMKLEDLPAARRNGAQGIALISDVWGRPDAGARLGQALKRDRFRPLGGGNELRTA